MNDTSREPQDSASEADTNSQPDLTTPPAEPASNGAKPQESPAAEKSEESVGLDVQLADVQAKANEYLDGWQRARAEFANYKKRAEKERDEAYQNGAVETLRKLLPVIDDFDRAVSNVPAEKIDDDVIKGFSLIHRKLLTLLENTGITVINPLGQEFNPAFHEAIGQDESSDTPSGHITMVLQKGYLYGDKVLRPALVRVAA